MNELINRSTYHIQRESQLDKIVFYICIIDILFAPYFNLIATNYSLPLVTLWYIIRFKKLAPDKENRLFIIMGLFMLASTMLSFLLFPMWVGDTNIWSTSVKKLIQYLSYILYYILFKNYLSKRDVDLMPYLVLFLCFGVVLAIIYSIDTTLFTSIKRIWNNYDMLTDQHDLYGSALLYRYGFIWSDPNNPAYAFIAVATFLVTIHKLGFTKKILLFLSVFFLLITSMSTGAFISLFVTLAVMIFYGIREILINRKDKISIMRKKIKLHEIFLFFLLVTSIMILLINWDSVFQSNLVSTSLNRVESNTSNSRSEIWLRLLRDESIHKYTILGQGATIVVDGFIRRPHSGQLYMIYGYGLVTAWMFMYFLFGKRKNTPWKYYIFEIPVFIGFTINTIVGEQKFIVLQMLLIAAASSARYRMNAERNILKTRNERNELILTNANYITDNSSK